MKKIYIISLILLSFCVLKINAQKDRTANIMRLALKGLEYEVKAGLNFGGVTPIPLPAEIRSLDSYNPTLAFFIEGNSTKWFNDKWGVMVGIKLENKGMKADATSGTAKINQNLSI